MNKVRGYAAVGTGAICLIVGALLAIDQAINSHPHRAVFVTTIILVTIGTVLLYVGMYVSASKPKKMDQI